jgi:5-hydroxyisourate hydrolase
VTGISTHVLDASTGTPATGLAVRLVQVTGSGDRPVAEAVTDADGRVSALVEDPPAGTYRLVFATGEHFARTGTATFYPEVVVTVTVTAGQRHHVPLLLSPFAYSTYRGS